MRLSVQRQCDGPSMAQPELTCNEVLELAVTVKDEKQPSEAVVEAWRTAAAELGWRRVGGKGTDLEVSVIGDTRPVLPDVRTWVCCPACATKMNLCCGRCGSASHGCSCMGGPRFDAVRRP